MDDDENAPPVILKDPLEPPEETVSWVYYKAKKQANLPAPIPISITGSIKFKCRELMWFNFDVTAHKMKLTNTGFSVFLSAKWRAERPYIFGGILHDDDRYIFSQLHFHWGANMAEGALHSVDGVKHPMEIHVSFFNTKYITQEEALKHIDGVVIYCYIIKYGVNADPRLDILIKELPRVHEAQRSVKISPFRLSQLLTMSDGEYFAYFGNCDGHKVMWIVSRSCMAASMEQIKEFRKLLDPYDLPNRGNFSDVEEIGDRNVYLVNAVYNLYASLLPLPTEPPRSISVLSPTYYLHPSLIDVVDQWLLPHLEEKANVNK